MLFTIRVVLTILFSAFAVWSQTPEHQMFGLGPGRPGSFSSFASIPSFQPQPSKTGDPVLFKLNFPQQSADGREIVLADNVMPELPSTAAQAPASRPKTFSYSSGYYTRQKIHKYASFATLPLIVSEAIVGQKLIDDRSNDSLRSAHSALAVGITALFGVESVTGIWNMLEARNNPSGRGKRRFHGFLMLAADAGLVATAATAPHREDDNGRVNNDSASTHRAVAYATFGVATISYVYMLFAR